MQDGGAVAVEHALRVAGGARGVAQRAGTVLVELRPLVPVVLSLDQFLIRKPEATFMLTVSGDSMIDAGIHPGDLVLVERGATPKSHDIVVAQVDDEWTLKYFIKDRGGVRLEPANRKYKSIVPSRSLVISGVVRTVIRKYE